MKVRYNSRLACDRLLEDLQKRGSWKGYSFGQKRDPCTSFFGKVMTSFTATVIENPKKGGSIDPSSENVSVTLSVNMPGLPTTAESYSKAQSGKSLNKPETPRHASSIQSLYSKTDSSVLKQLDPETLEPIGLAKQSILHPSLKGPLSSAHPKTDPITGDLYNYNLDLVGRYVTYRVFGVSASTGKTEILATISGPGIAAAYLHSLFLTPDYVVLCIWSAHFAMNGISIVWNTNILDSIAPFSPSNTTKWLVIDRHHGRGLVAEFESPAMFSFHTTNAWQDEKGDVICELVEYENLDILHKFYYEAIKSSSPAATTWANKKLPGCQAHMKRYRLSASHIKAETLNRAKAKGPLPQAEQIMCIPRGELASINPNYLFKPHRYVYSIVDRGLSTFFDGIAKTDTETEQMIYWDNEIGHTPGEPVFVANPEGKSEDDGVLLSVVLNGVTGTSYLLCLDARDLKELGRAEVGVAVGFGFHGAYVGDKGVVQNY
jgi:torulene dioxygenase